MMIPEIKGHMNVNYAINTEGKDLKNEKEINASAFGRIIIGRMCRT